MSDKTPNLRADATDDDLDETVALDAPPEVMEKIDAFLDEPLVSGKDWDYERVPDGSFTQGGVIHGGRQGTNPPPLHGGVPGIYGPESVSHGGAPHAKDPAGTVLHGGAGHEQDPAGTVLHGGAGHEQDAGTTGSVTHGGNV